MRNLRGTTLINGKGMVALLCFMACLSFARVGSPAESAYRGNDSGDVRALWDTEERGTISVSGAAREYVTPDVAILTLAVETTALTANDAVVENGVLTERMIASLKTLLGPGEEDSIRTTAYAVRPVYEYDREEKKSTLAGYRVTHQVRLRTEKTEMSGRIVDVAVRNGANRVEDVRFVLEEDQSRCERVLAIAVESAKRQGAFVASTLGAELGNVKSVVPSCGQDIPSPVYRQRFAEASQTSPQETVIESGEVVVRATVDIVFFLDQN